jgi:pimeloyl-ACP methyl ester carboxylesterase
MNDASTTHLPTLRGALQLGTEAVLGLSHVVEGVHQSVRGTLGLRGGRHAGRAGGLTGAVYSLVRVVTRGVGLGADAVLTRLPARAADAALAGPRREALLAALNGVLGDHLAASANPLATPMTLRHQGRTLRASRPLAPDAARPHVVVMLHGLCMNERQWREPKAAGAVEPAAALAEALDCTVLHLRYNSGRPIAANGRTLARLLERELARWPVPLERLSLVGHSMGGLVARHAIARAQRDGLRWTAALRELACLGTPHFGAPLERIGHWVDGALRTTPWSAPLARLGAIRSAGITDLRHGLARTGREALPALPPHVRQHFLAATLAARRTPLADRLLGDGLVPLRSALGEHAADTNTLAAGSRHVVYRTGHLQLLHHPEVTAQLLRWLTAP